MAKTKPQKTTRDTSFNFTEKDGTITTLSTYTATKTNKNIRLLGAEDGMSVGGEKIINHAAENRTMKDLNYDVEIDVNAKVTSQDDKILSGNNYRIYGAPFKSVLNNRQHYNNCGVESTLNTLAMAGIIKMKENLSDQKSTETKFLKNVWNLGLVSDSGVIGKLDEADGGTEPDDYKDILRQYDIDSDAYFMTRKCKDTQFNNINELAYKISQGCGAIVGVCSDNLWQKQKSESNKEAIDHAIAIVGVVYKEDTPPSTTDNEGNVTYNKPLGFYIHDTGAWMTRYISLDEFKYVTLFQEHGMTWADYESYIDYDPDNPLTKEQFEELYAPESYNQELRNFDSEVREYIGKKPEGIIVTLTSEPIKNEMFNLNATGDKQDNKIWGNSGDNVIKGMAGNDTLYGNAGDDEIRGGNGNDIIVGNNLYKGDLNKFKTYLKDTVKNRLNGIEYTEDYEYQEGINKLYGDAGSDIIFGGDDIDLIYGGAGDDYIWAGDGRNAVYGGAGNDIIIGGWENDRLFGDAGNDTIYGGADDDTIHGGTGNDTIYGGSGNDRIETGKNNDTIYFEGTEHGIDEISSEGGATTFRFIDEKNGDEVWSKGAKVSDMYFSLGKDENNAKLYDFEIMYTPDEDKANDGIKFNSLYNYKKNTGKSLTIFDAEDKEYKVSVSKAKTVNAASNKNNILFSLRDKGATITTSANNDVVTMVETEDKYNLNYQDATVYDSITYTGGKDRYVSEERDTHYYVQDFSDNTNLTIKDNINALEKVIGSITNKNVVSERDELYVNTASPSNLHFFFDVDKDTKTTMNDGLYILKNTDNLKNVITGDATGIITMDSFFKYDFSTGTAQEFINTDFYGNGRIETIYYGEGTNYDNYNTLSNLSTDLITIAGQVAGWLNNGTYNTGGYDNAFEAFNHFDELSGQAQNALVGAYSLNS